MIDAIYVVKYEDERLDNIVYKHYGNLDHIFTILELNPHVINQMYLEVGTEIRLPYFAEKEVKEIQLWE